MQENGIRYGFTITVEELPRTIPTLWPTVQEYWKLHAAQLPSSNMLPFVTDDQVRQLGGRGRGVWGGFVGLSAPHMSP